ncbi:hypothetical protein SCAR479_02527 [Seiridium cardinale]|uniref:Heterokaryon incompatibility domain-containing protein n=1 Tax=Seiridium cardinale TaxID=138064 RepID=A0ABR2Y2V9_9PEZI
MTSPIGTDNCHMPKPEYRDTFGVCEEHLAAAARYRQLAQWEDILREFEHADTYRTPGALSEPNRTKQKVSVEIGSIRYPLGRLSTVVKGLEQAFQLAYGDHLYRLETIDELAVMHQHSSNYYKAKESCHLPYARKHANTGSWMGSTPYYDGQCAFQTEADVLSAIGNPSRRNCQLPEKHINTYLLREAILQMERRVDMVPKLQRILERNNNPTGLIKPLFNAQSVGAMDSNRLSLVQALTGNMSEAVRYSKIWQKKTSHPRETSLRALLRSLYTSSLLRDDQVNVAKELLEPSYLHDMQACAVALCKKPSDEHSEYLRALADTNITLDQYDEQGYNALDYAVFNSEHEMERVVLRSLAKYHSPERVAGLKREALHKKHSREILHRHMRPVLTQGGDKIFQNLRDRYATLLGIDEAKRDLFDEFRVVRYSDFVKLGRLPSASDDITRKLPSVDAARYGQTSEETVVFLSYRWQKKQPNTTTVKPDDDEHTQYKRMRNALAEFLRMKQEGGTLSEDDLYIWLDFACIDQNNKDPGINALPIIILLCNAMISLVEDGFFERGWCGVEAAQMQALMKTYGRHIWYQHQLLHAETDRITDTLKLLDREVTHDASKLRVTFESDRPKIEFILKRIRLLRQWAELRHKS